MKAKKFSHQSKFVEKDLMRHIVSRLFDVLLDLSIADDLSINLFWIVKR